MRGPVVVTGANGFVGSALVERLASASVPVRAAVRRAGATFAKGLAVAETGALTDATGWAPLLAGAAAIVHCATRIPRLRDPEGDPLAAFMAVNRDATAHLARQAVAAGVRRFVFVSSIGVNGAETFVRCGHSAPSTYQRRTHRTHARSTRRRCP